MTGGEHFRHPGGGGSCAKPRISPRGVVATCGAHQIAPPKSHPGGGAWLCSRRSLMCIILIVNDIAYSLWCYDGLPPPPGWRKCSPPVIVSANGGGTGAAPDGKPRGGVPERNDPALTQLCSGCGVPPTTACRRYAPVAQWSVKARLKSEEWDKMQIQGATAQ